MDCNIRFSTVSNGGYPRGIYVADMALEARFENGKTVQSMMTYVGGTRRLIYRESRKGSWRDASGIPVAGSDRTPENIIRTIGKRDPVALIYVFPEP